MTVNYFSALESVERLAERSTHPKFKVGAEIYAPGFPDSQVVSCGVNALMSAAQNISGHDSPGMRRYCYEHAERIAIYAMAAAGVPVEGCTMVISAIPCADCARAIILSGICRVVFKKVKMPVKWHEACRMGVQLLIEAGIHVISVEVEESNNE